MARGLFVEVFLDTSQYLRGLRQAERAAGGFSKNLESTFRGGLAGSGAFKSLGRQVAFASSSFLGGVGLVAAIKSSVNAASNLNEQLSKSNVVFGDSAKSVEDWSKTTVDSMGLAQDQALATASSFGALFRPIGLTGQEAAKQSKNLTQLGGDLASFYNTDVQDALDAIKSGLVGEAEPLRRYGVLLTETRVQQEALKETGKKHAAQLTQQEKVLARITLIYKDTAAAQGDFARTGGGLANQLRKMQANVRQLQIGIGQQLLPIVLKAVTAFNDWISKSENQKRVLADVHSVVDIVKSAIGALKDTLDGLNKVTGSTRHTVELFVAAWAAWKVGRLITGIGRVILEMKVLRASVKTTTAEVGLLNAALTGLRFAGPVGLAAVAATPLIIGLTQPKSASFGPRQQYSKVGNKFYRLVPAGRTGVRRVEVSAEEYYAATGKTPPSVVPTPGVPGGPDRPARFAPGITAFTPPPPGARPLSLQGRFNLAELRLAQAGLTKTLADDRRILVVEKAIVEQQIASTKNLQEKIKFTQQLVQINGQILNIDQQAAQAAKEKSQALRDQADAIKQAILDQLQAKQTDLRDRQAIQDATRQLRTARALGGPVGIQLATRALTDAQLQARIDRLQRLPARLTAGGQFTLGNQITINVHGVTDPQKVAKAVLAEIRRAQRHGSPQFRGAATGAGAPR